MKGQLLLLLTSLWLAPCCLTRKPTSQDVSLEEENLLQQIKDAQASWTPTATETHSPALELLSLTLEKDPLYGNFNFPKIKTKFPFSHSLKILRCRGDYQSFLQSQLQTPLSPEAADALYRDTFADQRWCHVVTEGTSQEEYLDISAPRGESFYVLRLCSNSASSLQPRCLPQLTVSGKISVETPLSQTWTEKLTQLQLLEERYQGELRKLLSMTFQLAEWENQCFEGEAALRSHQQVRSSWNTFLTLSSSLAAGVSAGVWAKRSQWKALNASMTLPHSPFRGIAVGTLVFGSVYSLGWATNLAVDYFRPKQLPAACEKAKALIQEILQMQKSGMLNFLSQQLTKISQELNKEDQMFKVYEP